MPFELEMVDVRGTKTQLLRGGQGRPLLYLHSAGGETFWLPFHELLAQQLTVYAPAHPGFGESGGLEKIDGIEDLMFHYLDLLDTLKLEKVNVVGLSLGGWLGAELALRYPDRVEKLVLVDAAGLYVEGAPITDLFALMPETISARLRELSFYDPESYLAQTFIPDNPPMELMLHMLKSMEASARIGWNPLFHNPKLRGRLHRIKASTLILWGDTDKIIPLEHAKAYQQGIAGSQLVVLEKCGHMPPLEKPEEFSDLVIDFLTK